MIHENKHILNNKSSKRDAKVNSEQKVQGGGEIRNKKYISIKIKEFKDKFLINIMGLRKKMLTIRDIKFPKMKVPKEIRLNIRKDILELQKLKKKMSR